MHPNININKQLDKEKPIESQNDLNISQTQKPSLELTTDTALNSSISDISISKPEKIIIDKHSS